MKFYRAGDRSAGICEGCHSRVATRMEYRDYAPPEWDVTVPDVLVAVCERCDQVVGIPHQSTPRINEYRKVGADLDTRVSVEARVPREIDEALNLAAMTLGGSVKAIRPVMVRYYLAQMTNDPTVADAVRERSVVAAQGPADRRIAVKMDPGQRLKVMKAAQAVGITSKSALIRGIAMLAAEDCQIVPDGSVVKLSRASKIRHAFLKQLAGAI